MRRATSGRFMRRLCLRIHKPGVHSLNEACGFGLNLSRGRTEILPESRVSSPCRVRYSRPGGKHSYTLISHRTEGSGRDSSIACDPVRRMELGEPCGRGPRRGLRLGASGFRELPLSFSFFCLFLSPKAFVTDASLRSQARKNCLRRDQCEKLSICKLLFFRMLHPQRFGAWSAI
jgi:hypothetical protein